METNERHDRNELIAEYLSGNLEPARKAELEDWVNESDEKRGNLVFRRQRGRTGKV